MTSPQPATNAAPAPSVPRRRRWLRRLVAALLVLGALMLAAGLSFGPFVRARVAAEAARRNVEVEIGSVRPGWLAVRLLDVKVRPKGVEGVACTLAEVRAELDSSLRVRAVRIVGGHVDLQGSAEELRARLDAWRGASSGEPKSAGAPVTAEGLTVRWDTGGARPTSVEASGVAVSRDPDAAAIHVAAELASVRHGGVDVEVSAGTLLLEHGVMKRFAARALALDWQPPDAPPAPDAPLPAVQPAGAKATNALATTTTPPLVPLPNLRAMHARAVAAAAELAKKLPDGTEVAIDAFSFRTTRAAPDAQTSKERTPIALGPGPLAIARRGERVDVTLATRTGEGGAPLSVHADLPTVRGDVIVSLEGGPVPLALLGMEDGTAGLTDLDKGSVFGKARLVLAANADLLTFDADIQMRGISIKNRRLATDVVRGLDLGARAKGTIDDAGTLRLDDADFAMGALHVVTRGLLEQKSDRTLGSFTFDMPSQSCQSLIESMPSALIPNVVGSKWAGTFEAHAKFVFDSRKLDDLTLDYKVNDLCKVTELTPHLAKERFKKPFPHLVYAPDGTSREELTGPGTKGWTPIKWMSRFAPVAVVMTEDGGVYHKEGFNHPQIKLAVVTNLKDRRFTRGASTVIMQLAKNMFQARDKTLARKLEQVILTEYIAQTFTRDEVLELYLNLVEFGPNVYGVGAGAAYYFGKGAGGLTLPESIFLAAMLPSPVKFSYMRHGVNEAYLQSFDRLMEMARASHLVTQEDLDTARTQRLAFVSGWRAPERPVVEQVKDRAPGPRDLN